MKNVLGPENMHTGILNGNAIPCIDQQLKANLKLLDRPTGKQTGVKEYTTNNSIWMHKKKTMRLSVC